MKKICFFIGDIERSGGTERVTTLVANALSTAGYDVTILSLYHGKKSFFPLNENINLNALFEHNVSMKKNFIPCVYKLRKYVKKNSIHSLILVDSILTIFAVPALAYMKLQCICWEHFNYNVDLGSIFRVYGRKLAAKYCQVVVTLTERDKNLWIDNIKNIKSNIVAINNPNPYSNQTHLASQSHKRVLAVGRLTQQKGFDLLIQSWAKIAKKNGVVNWKLSIVGSGEDYDKLMNLIKTLNVQDSVEIFPATQNIAEFYQHSSVYCLSSRYEGFGMVLIEAQAYGLPIVAFDCKIGPAEIVEHCITGYLVKDQDIIELANKLEKIITLDVVSYEEMSENALNNSLKYSVGKILPKWITILEN